jgi:hypothetical protein
MAAQQAKPFWQNQNVLSELKSTSETKTETPTEPQKERNQHERT